MSGILDKKSRHIDYKLTTNGIKQLEEGRLSFKYYTLSDASIVYSKKFLESKKYDISDSESLYLPFEVSTYKEHINPEIYLDQKITTQNKEENYFNNVTPVQNTLAESIIAEKFLFRRNTLNIDKIDFKNFQTFEEKEFSETEINRYPTLKEKTVSISRVSKISQDVRFSERLRFKKLSPIGINRKPKFVESENVISQFFKNYSNLRIEDNSLSREEVAIKVLRKLESDPDIIKHIYELNKENKKPEDVYIFQLFEKNDGLLEKLHFIESGTFYDKKENKHKKMYFVGVLIRNIEKKEDINFESYTKKISVESDYSFINLFTMVVE